MHLGYEYSAIEACENSPALVGSLTSALISIMIYCDPIPTPQRETKTNNFVLSLLPAVFSRGSIKEPHMF